MGLKSAQQWGEYTCDLPKKTFDNLLDYIANEVKPDVMFWTGDNSAHDIWKNTEEEVTSYTITLTEMIKAKFESTDITVFPIQGNHDTWPVDIQSFEKPGMNNPINNFRLKRTYTVLLRFQKILRGMI